MIGKRMEMLEERLAEKKRKQFRLCWIRYNPSSELSYDIENAEEEVRWMIYETARLEKENLACRKKVSLLMKRIRQLS